MGLLSSIAADAAEESIIDAALEEALAVMQSMLVNEGQFSLFDSLIEPEFEANATAPIPVGWNEVTAGDYEDFLGETCEAGNQIMHEAYELAQAMQAIDTASGMLSEDPAEGFWSDVSFVGQRLSSLSDQSEFEGDE